jgi:hypothetical protein
MSITNNAGYNNLVAKTQESFESIDPNNPSDFAEHRKLVIGIIRSSGDNGLAVQKLYLLRHRLLHAMSETLTPGEKLDIQLLESAIQDIESH